MPPLDCMPHSVFPTFGSQFRDRNRERANAGWQGARRRFNVSGAHITAHEHVQAPASLGAELRKLFPPFGADRAIGWKVVADNEETPVTL